LLYGLHEALAMVEEEGLEARWARHRRNHIAFAAGIRAMGLDLLPPETDRLWTLNAVTVPDGIDEAAVRRHLLEQFSIEVGAGLGPLAGKIWRVGLMGSSSSRELIVLLLGALEQALRAHGYESARLETEELRS
jgi:alanine-glyoxylate transaminase/serine-glyoxylate transaminase/serine-pyruvate transaminase